MNFSGMASAAVDAAPQRIDGSGLMLQVILPAPSARTAGVEVRRPAPSVANRHQRAPGGRISLGAGQIGLHDA